MHALHATPPTQAMRSQRGAILIISLVILLVMTIIGVAAMQSTVLEEKMAGSLRDKSIAFQAAEAALRDAETTISSGSAPTVGTAAGWYSWGNASRWRDMDWSDTGSTGTVASYSGGTLDNVASDPTYIAEQMRPERSLDPTKPLQVEYYRITAHGVGGSANAVAILQSYYKL